MPVRLLLHRTPFGSMIFDFKINGGEVVGLARIVVLPGLAPIAEGKVDGDQISFVATGYLPSTTGTPTCRIEETLQRRSGDPAEPNP